MAWKKHGLIFDPHLHLPLDHLFAANPTVLPIDNTLVRVFFNARDAQNRAYISYFEVNLDQPNIILNIAKEPVLMPGKTGLFDDSGVSLGSLIKVKDQYHLYYLGWNLGVTCPWRNSIGLALSYDGKQFEKYANIPVLDRNSYSPYSMSYPFVFFENKRFQMWFGSNLSWENGVQGMQHVIKTAFSDDGIIWSPQQEICVPLIENEIGLSRPFVFKQNDVYHMYFSRRLETHYLIAEAISHDGIHFERVNDQILDLSPSGWDSQSIEYPYLISMNNQLYLFYCGNGYGKTGIGLAIQSI